MRGAPPFGTLPEFDPPTWFWMFPSREFTVLLVFSPLVFCADYQIEANIRYGSYPETVLDIIQSPAPALKNRPGVIVIHGAGDKAGMLDKFCVPLAQHDFVVANVEYRASEPAPIPISDVLAAAQWFHNHAARFKVDPDQILVLGEGSGGNFAATVAAKPDFKIVAVINFSGDGVQLTNPLKSGDIELIPVPGDMTKLGSQIFKWLKKRKVGS
jgi:acetyl esterase/lipase